MTIKLIHTTCGSDFQLQAYSDPWCSRQNMTMRSTTHAPSRQAFAGKICCKHASRAPRRLRERYHRSLLTFGEDVKSEKSWCWSNLNREVDGVTMAVIDSYLTNRCTTGCWEHGKSLCSRSSSIACWCCASLGCQCFGKRNMSDCKDDFAFVISKFLDAIEVSHQIHPDMSLRRV